MSENESELSQRLVVGHRRDGRRRYDAQAKRELVQACLQPGVSVAGMALRHGINANLLRKWIGAYGERGSVAGRALTETPVGSAFVRVREAQAIRGAGASPLVAQLPNGVRIELGGLHRDELLPVLHMLNTLPCSGSMRG